MRRPEISRALAAVFCFFGLGSAPARAGEGAAPREIMVLALEAPDEAAEGESWLPARLADLLSERLTRLGFELRDRRFDEWHGKAMPSGPGAPAVVSGRVAPKDTLDPDASIEVTARLSEDARGRDLSPIRARAGDLDRIATELAVQIAELRGRSVRPSERARLLERATPFAVHRLLGLARTHLDRQAFRKALIMYDRAAELDRRGLLEASFGRRLAEAELAARQEAAFGARADLAPPAAIRAEVAEKKGDDAEVLRALEAYLRYTPEHALRWRVEIALEAGRYTLLPGAQAWVVQSGEGDRRRWSFDPRTGAVLDRTASLSGLIGLAGGHAFALDRRVLTRFDERGRARWKLALPLAPRRVASVEITHGVVGVMGDDEIAWVDTSFGELGQRAKGVRPLASGAAGILVEETGQISLLRPGKRAPTWTTGLGSPLDAKLTSDRALVLSKRADGGAELVFLRIHDGKEAGRRVSLSPGARLLSADGRYAVVDLGEAQAALVDVLSAERAATLRGPGAPSAAATTHNGVAVLYATGDLLFFDRDGALLDRALPPGRPLDLVAGSPVAPGPVAVTTQGLFAYAEVSQDAAMKRDIGALLDIARALKRRGESEVALDLVEAIALLSAGRIQDAEALRAELAALRPGREGVVRAARARAARAQDPAKSVGRFVLAE